METVKDGGLARRGRRVVVCPRPSSSRVTDDVRRHRIDEAVAELGQGRTELPCVNALKDFDAVLCLRYEQLETRLVGRAVRWRTRTVELTRPLRADRAVRLVHAFEHVYVYVYLHSDTD